MAIGNELYAAIDELVKTWQRRTGDTSGEDITEALVKLRGLLRPRYLDEHGRELFCPRCGAPDETGYPEETLDS